ncbi:RNP-1 like RNA-binding protein, partial [Pelagophyceae sp. CCMP2097]
VELFVSHLPRRLEANDVLKSFSAVGTVTNVRLPIDAESGFSKGYAFVTVNAFDAARVLHVMHGTLVGRRTIGVEYA